MTGLYRLLLHLYPASFRTEYGDELRAVFERRWATASGPLERTGLIVGGVWDVARNAAAAHADILRQDLRYSARTLRRSAGFAVTVVLVVGLGVGANTAAFSVADFVLLRPLPFPHPERLVKLWESTHGYSMTELSPPNYRDWKAQNTSFETIGAFVTNEANIVGSGPPARLRIAEFTPQVFGILRIPPLLGHTFTEGEISGSTRELVLSYGLWQTLFGGDAGILGRSVNLDGFPYTVTGVMPPGFYFPNREVQLWTSLELSEDDYLDRNNNYLQAIGRLREGVPLEQARTDMGLITARLAREYPEANKDTGANLHLLRDEVSPTARLLLLGLCGAALGTLILACANLASLLLARAAARRKELSVRSALGAGRERLARQMITESLVLAGVGGLAGIAVAGLAVPLLSRLIPDTLPIARHPSLDPRILAMAILLTVLTGLGFGTIPALRAGGKAGFEGLREGVRTGGGHRRRLRATLVMVEVAVSVVLLISTGLLVRAVWRLQAVDPGFRAEGVLTLRTALPWPKYAVTAARERFYTQVLSGVRALPGVSSAAYISFLPLAFKGGIWSVTVSDQDGSLRDRGNAASLRYVTPQFFSTLGIPLRRGRDVAESDDMHQPFVAVVSESFVQRYWPNQDPVGKQFRFAFATRTIVGVVGDVRFRGLDRPSEPQVYLPYQQVPDSSIIFYTPKDLVIRSAAPVASLVPAIRRIVQDADVEQPVSNVQAMSDIVAQETASRKTQLRVLGTLALIALTLTGVGIHGLLSFTVAQRSQEIAVRRALGARPGRIIVMVLRDGFVLAIAGLVPGLGLAYAAGRALQALLVGITPGDPATFTTAVVVCSVMAGVGSLLPALRALRVDPMSAMRAI